MKSKVYQFPKSYLPIIFLLTIMIVLAIAQRIAVEQVQADQIQNLQNQIDSITKSIIMKNVRRRGRIITETDLGWLVIFKSLQEPVSIPKAECVITNKRVENGKTLHTFEIPDYLWEEKKNEGIIK